MSDYLVIGSRDPFDSRSVEDLYGLTAGLAEQGEVTLFLVQNGVLATRQASRQARRLADLAGRATVVADDFSLRERGIDANELVDGVSVAGVDTVVDLLAAGRKTFWH